MGMVPFYRISGLVICCLALVACAPPPPANPMERHARLAAGAEIAARQCAGYAGGYDGAQKMRQDANRNVTLARNLGATDADLDRARKAVQTTFDTTAVWISRQEACNQLVSFIAWESN
ncbi:hypothetical protein J1C52_09610 [Roseibaca sp. Y0-43]|nr:hypothetical protein [Roseibaca sp. Y0-43]